MSENTMTETLSVAADGATAPAPAPAVAEGTGVLDVKSLLAALRAATEEECRDLLTALHKGMPLYAERLDGPAAAAAAAPAPAPAKKAAARGRPKKAAAAAAAAAPPLPAGEEEDGAPSADAYRLAEDTIDMSTCLGRRFNETDTSKDKRWKPAVYRELQCGAAVADDCDLCKTCQRRMEKFAEDPKPAVGWLGRVTEDPPDWAHMLGTEWAETKKPKWLGGAAAAAADADAASDSGDSAEMSSVASSAAAKKAEKEAAKAAKAAEKEAAAEAKKAEKEAAAAAKKAEKEAAAATKKAEKEAAAAAKKAEKEAAAAAKKAEKPAAKKAPAKKAAAAAAAAAPAKADTAAEAAEAGGELKLIDGTLYMVKSGNVYEYDEMTETAGDFVGRLTEDETIDTDAEEVADDEE